MVFAAEEAAVGLCGGAAVGSVVMWCISENQAGVSHPGARQCLSRCSTAVRSLVGMTRVLRPTSKDFGAAVGGHPGDGCVAAQLPRGVRIQPRSHAWGNSAARGGAGEYGEVDGDGHMGSLTVGGWSGGVVIQEEPANEYQRVGPFCPAVRVSVGPSSLVWVSSMAESR